MIQKVHSTTKATAPASRRPLPIGDFSKFEFIDEEGLISHFSSARITTPALSSSTMRLRAFLNKQRSKPIGEKNYSSSKGLFRSKSTATTREVPSIRPALTLTLSDDEEYPSTAQGSNETLTIQSPKIQTISKYVFTEEEIRTNELNHMRELAVKQQEIVKMQAVHDELRQALKRKEQKLAECHEQLEATKEELSGIQSENASIKVELSETKIDLDKTKHNLNVVGSALIQSQHALEETKVGGFLGWF